MGLLGDVFGAIGSAVSSAVDFGAQFIGGVGETFGVGLPGRGEGLGVLAPRDLGRAGEIGRIVGGQAVKLGGAIVAQRIGLPTTSSDLGDIYAGFPQLPPAGRGRGVLDPMRATLPAGRGGNVRAETFAESVQRQFGGIVDIDREKAAAAAAGGVENLQTAGVGSLLGLLPGIGLGLGVEKAVEFVGGLFGGGEETGMASTRNLALPGGRSVEVSLPLGGALFRVGRQSLRPARVVVIPNPLTGEPTFFGNLGKPLLFTRDLSAAKKVAKLARRVSRRGR